MNKKVSIACCLIGLSLMGCGGEDEKRHEAGILESIPVEVTAPRRADIGWTLSFAGNIQPYREASLGAQISGKVERIFVDIGDKVHSGQLMVQMSGEQLTQAEAKFRAAQKDWERMKSLLAKGTITHQAFDQVDAAYQAAEAAYELVLASTQIKAPFSGVVTAKYLDEGEVFTMFPGSAGSPAILKLVQLDTVKVIVQAAERDLAALQVGLLATIRVDSYPGQMFEGSVRRVEPVVDPRTRTTKVEIVIVNKDGLLRPGMFARSDILMEDHPDALVLPRECVLRSNGESFVYVAGGGVAWRRAVDVGLSEGDVTEVVQGVSLRDSVICVGQRLVKDGSAIKVSAGPDVSEEARP